MREKRDGLPQACNQILLFSRRILYPSSSNGVAGHGPASTPKARATLKGLGSGSAMAAYEEYCPKSGTEFCIFHTNFRSEAA